MVDRPDLDPQAFAKRAPQGVPRLTAQTPNFRAAPTVTAFASDTLADTLVSASKDSTRLAAMQSQQFRVNQQQIDTTIASIKDQQTLEAEELFARMEVQYTGLSDGILEGSATEDITSNSVEAYDKLVKTTLDQANLSPFQRDYLSTRTSEGRNAIAKGAIKAQASVRAAERAAAAEDIVRLGSLDLTQAPGKFTDKIEGLRSSLLASGYSEKEADQYVKAAGPSWSHTAHEALLLQSPAAAQEALNEGRYNDYIDGDDLIDFKQSIVVEQERLRKAAEAKLKAAATALKDDVKDYAKVVSEGRKYKGAAHLEEQVRATGNIDLIQDYARAKNVGLVMRSSQSAGLQDLKAAEAALLSRRGEPITADELAIEEAVIKRARQVEADITTPKAITMFEEQGLIDPVVVDINDPATLLTRVKQHKGAAEHHGIDRSLVPVLKPLEVDGLGRAIKGATGDEFLALSNDLIAATDQVSRNAVLRQIADVAPSESFAVELSTSRPDVARTIRQGSIARDELGSSLNLNKNKVIDSITAYVGDSLRPEQDPKFFNSIVESSLSYLVGSGVRGDAAGLVSEKDVKGAVGTILGQISKYNGAKVIAPHGIASNQFEKSLDALSEQDFVDAMGGVPVAENGDEIDFREIIQRGQYQFVGNGQYIINLRNAGTLGVKDAEGNIAPVGVFNYNVLRGQ